MGLSLYKPENGNTARQAQEDRTVKLVIIHIECMPRYVYNFSKHWHLSQGFFFPRRFFKLHCMPKGLENNPKPELLLLRGLVRPHIELIVSWTHHRFIHKNKSLKRHRHLKRNLKNFITLAQKLILQLLIYYTSLFCDSDVSLTL